MITEKFVYIGKMPQIEILGVGRFVKGNPVDVKPETASLLQGDPDFKKITDEPKTSGGKKK